MEKEIKIDSLNIKIGGREIELSLDEAKKLHKALSEIFTVDKKVEHVHHYDYYRYWPQYYSQPVYKDYGIVYCSTANAGNKSLQSHNMQLTIS